MAKVSTRYTLSDEVIARRKEEGRRLEAALDRFGWSMLRFSRYLGERGTIVRNWIAGRQGDIPGPVLAWAEMVTAPLSEHPKSPADWRKSEPSDMTGGLLRWLLMSVGWLDEGDSAPELARRVRGLTTVQLSKMLTDEAPIPKAFAEWIKAITLPIRQHPMPEGWQPRVQIEFAPERREYVERPIPGRDFLSQIRAKREAKAAEREAERREEDRRRQQRTTPLEERVRIQTEYDTRTAAYHAEIARIRQLNLAPAERAAASEQATAAYSAFLETRYAEMRRLSAQGWTQLEIATRFGVTRARVGQVLRLPTSPAAEETAKAA